MKTVLFVCVHNAARNRMAEALFNEITEKKHFGISAGNQSSKSVNPDMVNGITELGIIISDKKPKRHIRPIVKKEDKVVTMCCGEKVCPSIPKEIQDWEIEGS